MALFDRIATGRGGILLFISVKIDIAESVKTVPYWHFAALNFQLLSFS
jgi:hypothetical protein